MLSGVTEGVHEKVSEVYFTEYNHCFEIMGLQWPTAS